MTQFSIKTENTMMKVTMTTIASEVRNSGPQKSLSHFSSAAAVEKQSVAKRVMMLNRFIMYCVRQDLLMCVRSLIYLSNKIFF